MCRLFQSAKDVYAEAKHNIETPEAAGVDEISFETTNDNKNNREPFVGSSPITTSESDSTAPAGASRTKRILCRECGNFYRKGSTPRKLIKSCDMIQLLSGQFSADTVSKVQFQKRKTISAQSRISSYSIGSSQRHFSSPKQKARFLRTQPSLTKRKGGGGGKFVLVLFFLFSPVMGSLHWLEV